MKVIVLDASWEVRAVSEYVDNVLTEFPDYLNLREVLIGKILLNRIEEVAILYDVQSLYMPFIPSDLYRHIHSVPNELTYRIDREVWKRIRHMRSVLGERTVSRIKIKVKELLLELEC